MTATRLPRFYTDFGVADTVEGRFDLLMLNVSLVVRRLNRENGGDREAARELTEAFFADMDRTIERWESVTCRCPSG
ncbi:Ubiquinol-cytochrome C chaperone [Methylobrevis pamukkalensis]|uniref:Ubiquinol-cytochrome C chaperone n=1 Tax=Methylobrevis pamukkalensis TaxID=1439726 RepID=A0A1E3H4T5_9HYPH|nr:ubiquinol-cytochrome C chaperone family protein [Methylobrevis pamukkalensis]ODN71338.1 Ubiquinol-cytochrome C chaperone [Methylobrevis pamukkalensis]